MVRTHEIKNELRSLLHDKLTDPNSKRRSRNKPWVFTHQPKAADMPVIEIKSVDAPFDKLSVGNHDFLKRNRIQVDVRLRVNGEYDFDADSELETASDGVDYLLSQIVSTVKNNHSTLEDNLDANFHSIRPNFESDVLNLGKGAIQKSIDFECLTQG